MLMWLLLLLAFNFLEGQHVPQGVTDFLPDLALREFY
jgi:hypothetical protein